MDAAAKWCSEMGAVSLEEIAENIEVAGDGCNLHHMTFLLDYTMVCRCMMRSIKDLQQ